ncbi:ROK family transcriptional regulator [Petroclostridium sp. X23]|uniref:ROK family transcriptional regulator n=1 Tax=Petroclostridium sp. X23 TaxID=3045146 RepID=UPI0024AD5CA3|nr:ROK family transcriptional regulator [Petroclostridium sp. X23]WHH56871.1 ROK family transcriptional regulator [Petroclostridium sp. X23]
MGKQLVPGSFSLMKKMNTSLILNTVREKGPVSRAEIAKMTGLTPATVTNITAELISYNLILEAERGESSGGRKPVMLRINSNGYCVVGVYIGSKGVKIIVANLNSEPIYQESLIIDGIVESDIVLKNITEIVSNWMSRNKDKKILGMGVGVHGLVKSREGISIYAPNLGWENVPVKQILEDALDIPVFVDNDVRTMTLGESWFGRAKNISNFVFIYVGYGIGGSIVIDNQLYRGASEGAGEVGHTTIDMNGPKCSCGNCGCLQTMASEQAMMRKIKDVLENGEATIISDWISGDLCSISPEIIYKAALHNDPVALRVIKETAVYLGVAVANLINTFNPSLVIINGRIAALGETVMKCIQEEVGWRSMKYLQSSTNIIFSTLNQSAVLKGTVALVMSEIFEDPHILYSSSTLNH